MSWWYSMKACFRPKAKWVRKNADGGSSVKCGFELAFTVFNEVDHWPLIDCQSSWRAPHLFEAAIGS